MWCAIFFFLSLDGKVIYFMIHLLKVNIVSFWCDIRIIWNGDTECDVIKFGTVISDM